jgi:hypothetical protein
MSKGKVTLKVITSPVTRVPDEGVTRVNLFVVAKWPENKEAPDVPSLT